MMFSRRLLILSLLLVLLLQASLHLAMRGEKSVWAGVPPVPSYEVAQILSFGDRQTWFRLMGLSLQHMGDTGGDVTPLHAYDYARLRDWFFLTDSFDAESDYIPTLAGFYFGLSRESGDIAHISAYLAARATADPVRNWRWLYHAVYLTRYRAGDQDSALVLARQMYRLAQAHPEIPVQAQQILGLVQADQGEYAAACQSFVDILRSNQQIDAQEILFMRWFLETRIRPQAEDGITDCMATLPQR